MLSDVGNKVSVVGYALKAARSASAPAGNKKHPILLENFQHADTDMVSKPSIKEALHFSDLI